MNITKPFFFQYNSVKYIKELILVKYHTPNPRVVFSIQVPMIVLPTGAVTTFTSAEGCVPSHFFFWVGPKAPELAKAYSRSSQAPIGLPSRPGLFYGKGENRGIGVVV